MGFCFPGIVQAKKILQKSPLNASQSDRMATEVPKGYLAVYVGENEMKRFVIPVSYLNHSSFQEFGFNHPMGGLTILCREGIFMDLIYSLHEQ